MSEQKFWLVGGAGLTLLLGLIYWLHAPKPDSVQPARVSPDEVARLIDAAVAPLQEKISEQAAQLESLAGVQRQLVNALEENDLSESLEQQIALNAAQTRDSLKADLERYETRLDDLQARANDPAVANEIAATRAEIGRIESLLGDLSDRVDCASLASQSSVRTLVIPARSSLEVPGETIVISVGRLRDDALDAVSVNARAAMDEPISTRVIGAVPIGGNVAFRHESMDYTATFTHATRRFLNTALIGVELRSAPIELAECRSSR